MSAQPSPPPTGLASARAAARCIISTNGGEVSSPSPQGGGEFFLRRRRSRLLERMSAGKGVDLRQRTRDPGEIRKRRGVDIEEFCAGRLARDTDIGERDLIAVAIAADFGTL